MESRDEILKRQRLIKNNICSSFIENKVEEEEETFEKNIKKGISPKNKWQKIIDYKWKDAIVNSSFKEYISKELGNDDFDNVSFTERERLLRDKDYISKADNDELNIYNDIREFIKGYPLLDDFDYIRHANKLGIPEAKELVYSFLNEELEKAKAGSVRKLQGKHYEKNTSGEWVSLIKGEENSKFVTLEDVLSKWNLPPDGLKEQIELGLGVEKEHTDDIDAIFQIVLQNLKENKEYYTQAKPEGWAKKEIDGDEEEVEKSIVDELEKGMPEPKEGETRNWKDGLYKFIDGHWKKQIGSETSKKPIFTEKKSSGSLKDKLNYLVENIIPIIRNDENAIIQAAKYGLKLENNKSEYTIKDSLGNIGIGNGVKAAMDDYAINFTMNNLGINLDDDEEIEDDSNIAYGFEKGKNRL